MLRIVNGQSLVNRLRLLFIVKISYVDLNVTLSQLVVVLVIENPRLESKCVSKWGIHRIFNLKWKLWPYTFIPVRKELKKLDEKSFIKSIRY